MYAKQLPPSFSKAALAAMLMQYMLIIAVPSLINPTEQPASNQPIKNKEVPQQLIEKQTENLVLKCCYVCCLL